MGVGTYEGLLVDRSTAKGFIPDLLQYDDVWAEAGTWNDLVGIGLLKLVEASWGTVTDLKRV